MLGQSALDRVFHALADSTRRALVERLSRGPASVSDLAKPLDMTLAGVVQHLQVLEQSGVIHAD
jgi:DNA-binding transcriptional ArsR family regulator